MATVHTPPGSECRCPIWGTWYTIMLVLNGTNKCFKGADWRDLGSVSLSDL